MNTQRLLIISCASDKQRGFSMIEVLVTFFVLSIGLLGLIAMQLKSVQYNQEAYIRTQALGYGNMMLDMMRVDLDENRQLADFNFDFNKDISVLSGANETQLNKNIYFWRTALSNVFPGGTGSVSCDDSSRVCEVTIRWDDRLSPSKDAYQYITVMSEL